MTTIECKDTSDNRNEHTKHFEEQNENGELVKLSEESLKRQPEEVFDIICKLGEGSYGSVYKALHKESGQVLAIKQVPIDTDLQEIIKEISIMQQCDSLHVVKYYGSYFKDSDLWIVMEYCGAGSVSDIMRLRKKTLTEEEIATVLFDTLQGLEYLHLRRKIHRDIKAGNILLNTHGHAKLADFGVAGQLSDTMAKRNTVIGTPFWMAPEVIQEIGYDCVADIWSLGITALEMAESKPPYGDIHPMRAIFMIPTKPPPSFREPDQWTPEFIDFVSRCLVKNPEERATATQLLQHEFIQGAQPVTILRAMIEEAMEIRENQNTIRHNHIKHLNESQQQKLTNNLNQQQQQQQQQQSPLQQSLPNSHQQNNSLNIKKYPSPTEQELRNNQHNQTHHQNNLNSYIPAQDDDDVDSRTMVRYSGSSMEETLKPSDNGTLLGTPIPPDDFTGVSNANTLSTDLGTMVINSDGEGPEDQEDEDSTMKRHDTAPGEQSKKYRPLFLDHFDKKEQEKKARSKGSSNENSPQDPPKSLPYIGTGRPLTTQSKAETQLVDALSTTANSINATSPSETTRPPTKKESLEDLPTNSQQQLQNNTAILLPCTYEPYSKPLSPEEHKNFENQLQRQLVQINEFSPHQAPPPRGVAAENQPKFQRSFIDGDFEFLKHLTNEELNQRMATLDQEMEREIDELRQRYQAKRQPILDAMDHKRRRQQNF